MYDTSAAETLAFHRSIVVDDTRTQTFLRAILQAVGPGDVVVDIGAGTGLLSLFACAAGAEHVFAVEQGPVAVVAREVVAANGVADRVTVVEGWSTAVDLPVPGDVLITETIGNAGFEEGIVAWVDDARQRLLAPEARILPERITLLATLVECPTDYQEVAEWRSGRYGIDFGPATRRAARQLWPIDLSPAHVVCDPVALVETDLGAATVTDLAGRATVRARRDALVHGIGLWFHSQLVAGHELSNPPGTADSSWTQVLLPLEEPLPLRAGDALELSVESVPDGSRWTWAVAGSTATATHHSQDGELRAPGPRR